MLAGFRLRSLLLPIALLGLCFYFSYHFLQGDRGLFSWIRLNQNLERQTLILNTVEKQYNRIKQRVELLSKKNLDLNLLEERVKAVLNYSHNNELVIREPVSRYIETK